MNEEDEIIHVEMNEEDVQNLVNCYEKDIRYIKKLEQELERYKNIVDELEEYLKEEERINNGIIINLASGNVARMDAGVKNGVLDKVLDKLKELKERNKIDE